MSSMTKDEIATGLFDEVKRLQRENLRAVAIAKALAGRLDRVISGRPCSYGAHPLESHTWCGNAAILIRKAKKL